MKNNYKKCIIIGLITIALALVIKIGYCCTYVGDILITYPWDEYTVFEKAASIVMGYSDEHMTKQELYDKKLITKDQTMFKKFNDSHYEK